MASPWHTESDGTPTCWGCSKADDARHVWMEDVQSRMRGFQDVFSLKYAMQIAQAVRNAQALFLVVFPTEFDKATKGFAFSLQSWASNTAYIDIAIQTNSIDPSPVLVNEATQCLLGNPAACPDESDLMFQMLISGGSGPTPHISCSIQTHCFTK